MRIEPAIALINDNQNLNDRKVLEFFVDLLSEKDPGNITVDILEDYLKIQQIDENSRYTDIANRILDELDDTSLQYYQEYLSEMDNNGIEFVPFYREEYPERLWSLTDAPLCLYVDGDLSALSDSVAVVGTREANDHRIEFAHKIAEKLVEMNKTVASGLAHGVDAAAHKGALDAGEKQSLSYPETFRKFAPLVTHLLGRKSVKMAH